MKLNATQYGIPPELVRSLDLIGCKTATDILFSTPADLYRRLPPGTLTYSDFQRHIRHITAASSASGTSGNDLLRAEESNSTIQSPISTGNGVLDALLDGFRGAHTLEVSGDKGSGKTGFALLVVLRHLSNFPESFALWIDATGDFSAERATQLLDSCAGSQAECETVLDRLQVSLAFDLDSAYEALDSARVALESSTAIQYIVIDTITNLLSPLLSATSSQGHATMTHFMRQLRELAHEFGITILVLNNATRSTPNNPHTVFESEKKPALGPSFPFLTDATLWLWCPPGSHFSEDDESSEETVHVAEILRSKTTQSKVWCTFRSKNGMILA
ncbi:hypothetical protein HGRIS_002973 [Hohenbuehelia grisea]|uniref:RecA family profile 1 domain-containing protein n=1 Tax=Hohenbuehelia grisea TaxID=104357 RepID=A0ABR3JN24_9AGAR